MSGSRTMAPARSARAAAPQQAPHRTAHAAPHALRLGAGERLPADVRDYFEPRFEADFSDVRLHRGAAGAAAAAALHAEAFTHGTHIAMGPGRFAPSTSAGRQLLGHELAHVVQQRRGGSPSSGRADAATEHDASRAGLAAASGAAAIPVHAASGVVIARQEKPGQPDKTRRNVGRANSLFNAFLDSPMVPDSAKKAVEGGNEWLKTEASKHGFTEAQREQVVSAVVEILGAPNVESARTLVVPAAEPPKQKPAPLPAAAAAKPAAAMPAAGAQPQAAPDFSNPFAPRAADPGEIHWVGAPNTRPSWTRGMRMWTDPDGTRHTSSPDTGETSWSRDGRRLDMPAPGADEARRAFIGASEVSRDGGRRHVPGKGWLDEAGWQAHLKERRAALAPGAARRLDNLKDATEAWRQTQTGLARAASGPSHLLGGRSLDDPRRIVAEARQSVEIGLHEIDRAYTPDELAEAERHVAFATEHGERAFGTYKEDVYAGADRTITAVEAAPFIVATVGTAGMSTPLIATYGSVGLTLKVMATGAAIGGGLSAGRQLAQMHDGSRSDFSVGDVAFGAAIGAALPFVPGAAPLLTASGVQSSGNELSQGHYATGAFDAAMVATPFAIKAAPPVLRYVRPRIAGAAMRIGVGLSEVPAYTGEPGATTSFVAEGNVAGPRQGAAQAGSNYLTVEMSPSQASRPAPVQGRAVGSEVWTELAAEMGPGTPAQSPLPGVRGAVADAQAAGLIGAEGAPGSVDAAFQPHRTASDVRGAYGVTGAQQQSAHVNATSMMRDTPGYSREGALTMLLDPATHRGFDNYWKNWARAQPRGRPPFTVAEMRNVMQAAVDQIPNLTPGQRGALAWQLELEIFGLGLNGTDTVRIPYSD